VRAGQQLYVIAGMTTADQFERLDPSFLTAIRSFRELSQQEADRIQPSRLAFYDVRSGDTWASIAARAGSVTPLKPATLAVMNGSDAANPPKAGTRIRVVTAGSR
jgi:predicted Zn-dependent protease